MSEKPSWLPEMVPLDGQWQEIRDRLYLIFEYSFKKHRKTLWTLPVWWNQKILPDGKGLEEGFWHLVGREDKVVNERLFDPERAKRLSYSGAVIENADAPEVRAWHYRVSGKQLRAFLWLVDWDYVLILERRNIGERIVYFLITAYHVDGDSTRHGLERKYEQREP